MTQRQLLPVVVDMANNPAAKKKTDKDSVEFAGDESLTELIDKANTVLLNGMAGRPYMLVVTSGYEIGRDGEKHTLSSQWSWRSNVFINTKESAHLADFLASQLKDVVDHPEGGIKKKYGIK